MKRKADDANVTLALLDASHADATLRWVSDPFIAQNLGLRAAPTLDKTLQFIATSNTEDRVARAILLDGVHVGNIVLDQIDRRTGKAHLHIYIGDPGARGHGVGQRAVALAVAHAFTDLGLYKVWLTVHVRNTAAIRAYQAVGFVIEGTHRGEFLLGGERIDEHYMGVLRPDAE